MNIQQIRYKNKFTTQINALPGTDGLYTMKLIVQPILENAIYHGMASAEDDGLITVTARREGEDLVIDVADNGLGDASRGGRLSAGEDRPEPAPAGRGLECGVHRRIRLTFGDRYGLTIFSEPDEGTTVRIRLPALDQDGAAQYQREDVP